MKLLSTVGGFFLLCFLTTATKADISLTLRNNPYLPPPIQEVPVKENFYTNTYENTRQQQRLKETRYKVFEVHNHYEPSIRNGQTGSVETNFINNEYLPSKDKHSSPRTEEIHIEHINAPANFPLDDPNLDASYLSLTDEGQSEQEIIVKHEFKAKENSVNNIPIPFPSNYRHQFPDKSHKQIVQEEVSEKSRTHLPSHQQQEHTSQQQEFANQFKGPDYLPPLPNKEYSGKPQHNSITAETQIQKAAQKFRHKKEYLPPIPTKSVASGVSAENVQNHYSSTKYNVFSSQQYGDVMLQRNFSHNTAFKNSDHLSSQQHQQQGALTYHDNFANQQQQLQSSAQSQQNQQQQNAFQSQHNLPENVPFMGLDYLPPHQYHQQQQSELQPQQSLPQNTPFKDSDYRLPYENQQEADLQDSFAANAPYTGPDYLPPHQDHKAVEQTQQNISPNAPFKGPDYLPPYQQPQQLMHQTTSQSHTPSDSPYQQQQNQVFRPSVPYKERDVSPPNQELQTPKMAFKGPDYLPPEPQQQENNQFQPNSLVFKGPDYLPPPQESRNKAPFKGPDYLPPPRHQEHVQRPVQEQHTQFQQPEVEQHLQNLPFGYDFQKPANPEQAIAKLHTFPDDQSQPQYQKVQVQTQIQASDHKHLPPPHHRENLQRPVQEQLTQFQQPEVEQHFQNLPLSYDFQKPANPEQAIAKLHTFSNEPLYRQVQVQTQIQASDHKHSGDIDYDTPKQSVPLQNTGIYQAPAYLPPDYVSQKPKNFESAIQQLHDQFNTDAIRDTVNPTLSNQFQNVEQLSKEASNPNSVVPGNLPAGYDFSKPVNAEQAINQLHGQQDFYQPIQANEISQANRNYEGLTTQDYQQSNSLQRSQHFQNQEYNGVQQQTSFQQIVEPVEKEFKGSDFLPPVTETQIFKGPDYLPPKITSTETFTNSGGLISTTGGETESFNGLDHLRPPTTASKPFKGPDYLPPKVSSQSVSSVNHQENSLEFRREDYMLPVSHAQSAKKTQVFGANDVPPPTAATIGEGFQPTVMYPLRDFMTNVKPNDRYANERKPFLEYGLPPPKTITKFNSISISPMFSQPTNRPQYYAPAMSYTAYTTRNQNQGSSALSRQAKETLQTFMPQDIRQQHVFNPIPVHTASTGIQTAAPVVKQASSKIRTVQIVKPTEIKTLKVLESVDHTGVKTIKILGPSLDQPMGEHRIVKVLGGSHEQNVQTVKIFNDQQDVTPLTNQQSQSIVPRSVAARQKRNSIRKLEVKIHDRK